MMPRMQTTDGKIVFQPTTRPSENVRGLDIRNLAAPAPVRAPWSNPDSPAHSGPPSQSLVITTGIPPITVNYHGRVHQFSRHKIARDLGMSPSTVSKIFSGHRNLTLAMALRLREYFGCSLDYLIDVLIPSSRVQVLDATQAERVKILAERNCDWQTP